MKLKIDSRKFIFTAIWNILAIIAIITPIIIKKEVSYMSSVITIAGTITIAYLGIQGYADVKNK